MSYGRIPPVVGGAGHCLVGLAISRCRVLVGLSLTVLLKLSSEACFTALYPRGRVRQNWGDKYFSFYKECMVLLYVL